MSEKYLNYINNFRGFVIILIVAVHCVSSNLLQWSDKLEMRSLLHTLLHGSSVFYVYIAGFMFQVLSSKYEYLTYVKKKFLYVFVPYVIVSIPAIIDEISSPKAIYENHRIWEQVLIYYSTGIHMSHFWFIPMIIIFYIISPIFYYIDKLNLYIIVPGFLTLALFIPREIYPAHNPLFSALHFFGFYLLGMWVSKRKMSVLKSSEFYYVGVFLSILFVYLTLILSDGHFLSQVALKIIYVIKFSLMCVTFTLIFYKFDRKIGRNFNFLAVQSFGIYFLHNYFIVLYERILEHLKIELDGVMVVLSVAIVMASSIILIYMTKLIFGKKSKYLIGC